MKKTIPILLIIGIILTSGCVGYTKEQIEAKKAKQVELNKCGGSHRACECFNDCHKFDLEYGKLNEKRVGAGTGYQKNYECWCFDIENKKSKKIW